MGKDRHHLFFPYFIIYKVLFVVISKKKMLFFGTSLKTIIFASA